MRRVGPGRAPLGSSGRKVKGGFAREASGRKVVEEAVERRADPARLWLSTMKETGDGKEDRWEA